MTYRIYVAGKRLNQTTHIDMGVDDDYPAVWTDVSEQVNAAAIPLAFFEGTVSNDQFAAINQDPRYFVLTSQELDAAGNPKKDESGELLTDYYDPIPNEAIAMALYWLQAMGVDTEIYDITSVIQQGKTRAECADALVTLFKTPRVA